MVAAASAMLIPALAQAGSCCPGHASAKKDAPASADSEAKVVAQTTCPVMGGKINRSQYVDHDGKRIYMCCPGCAGKLKADPAKYIKKLEDAGVTLTKIQTTCPVMGGKINKSQYVDHDGKRIYMCCPGCAGKLKADPEKYIKQLEDAGVTLDTVPHGKEAVQKTEGRDKHHYH
jgi:YHS domain-containing protein